MNHSNMINVTWTHGSIPEQAPAAPDPQGSAYNMWLNICFFIRFKGQKKEEVVSYKGG